MYKENDKTQFTISMIQFYAIFKVKLGIHNVNKEHRVPITQPLGSIVPQNDGGKIYRLK